MLSTAQQHATVPSSLHDAFLSSMASTDFTNPALLIPSFNIPQQRAFGHPTQLQAFPLQPHHGLLPPAGGAAALMGQARPPFGRFPYSGTLPMGVPSHAPLPREGSNSGRTSQQQSLNKGQLGSVPGQDQQTAAGMQDAMLQAFDPTVRRPGQNFSEASSVLEDPLMRPYLLLQIPAAQDVYEPKRPLPNFCAVCHAPY